MDQISTEVRLLYYLNLTSKKKSVMEYLAADLPALHYFIDICSESRGTATSKQTSKKIMKTMKEAASLAAICL